MPAPSHIHVLLIEDDDLDARLIEEALAEASDLSVDLERNTCLRDGLHRLSQGGIDVLLLDLNLIDSQGTKTVAVVRSRFFQLPIVVLTGLDERDVGLAAIQAGAQDYLPKNRADSEVLSRSLHYAIERRQIEETNRELAAAREIQDRLFPSSAPSLDGYDIAGICHPARIAGGDYFDYVALADETLGILVADVSGSGLGAAVLMGETRASIRALARAGMNPEQSLASVNTILFNETSMDRFITIFFLHLDPVGRTVRCIGAGHEAHLLRGGTEHKLLKAKSLPLAVADVADFRPSAPIALRDGDIVILLTDGITEAHRPSGEMFGVARSLKLVRENASLPAREIANALYNATLEYTGNHTNHDDTTVVIVKVTR